jgi:hypothetical protein
MVPIDDRMEAVVTGWRNRFWSVEPFGANP